MRKQRALRLAALIAAGMLVFVMARAQTYTVTTTFNDGPGSLREGIMKVNTAGVSTIEFNIPPDDGMVKTILLTNALPAITNSVTLNGFSQPGAGPHPLIELTWTNQLVSPVGLNLTAGLSFVGGLILNGFDVAIVLQEGGDNIVAGNFIGTDANGGNVALFPNEIGISVSSAGNLIGGTGNLISGNFGTGIQISGPGASNNVVQGNFIGTDIDGMSARPNGWGIVLDNGARGTLIGGTNDADCNLISGNSRDGILILNSSQNLIQNNFIGTDSTGTNGLSNLEHGIQVEGPLNKIGDPDVPLFDPNPLFSGPPRGNVISANENGGVWIMGSAATGNVVVANFIGTDFSGRHALGNHGNGITVSSHAHGTQIGKLLTLGLADIPPCANVIGANDGNGISIGDSTVIQGTTIDFNSIGTDLSRSVDLGNAGHGVVLLGARDTRIQLNTVWLNDLIGVAVGGSASSTNNVLTENSIAFNGGLGIDLAFIGVFDGVTTNDNCDADVSSVNRMQNFPVLTSAMIDPTNNTFTINGFLNSTPNTEFILEFYRNTECDPSGHGEGRIFLDYTNVTTSADCTNFFSITFPKLFSGCSFITATATDPDFNTSEFSQCIGVGSEGLCVLPPPGLVSWWPGDGSTTNLVEGGSNGVLSNGTTFAEGKVEEAFSFDGVNDFVLVTNSPALQPSSFTLDAWVNFASVSGFGRKTLISKPVGAGFNASYALYLEGGRLRGAIGTLSGFTSTLISDFSPATGMWYFVAYTFDAATTNHAIYVNGVLQKSAKATVASPTYDGSPLFIGADRNVGVVGEFLSGRLDEVEIFDRALSSEELQALFCAGSSGKCRATDPCSIMCPDNVVETDETDQCGAVVDYDLPIVEDECPAVECIPPPGTFFSHGTTPVTCTTNGSTVCTIQITVQDPIGPTITCLGDVTADNELGECFREVIFADPFVDDNCPGVTLACDPPSGSQFPVGMTTVICTATDAAGNIDMCSFNVTVEDNPPEITCPADISVDTTPGACTRLVTYPDPTATDNCPGVIVDCNPPSGFLFPKGATTVDCTATDSEGNTDMCSFNVTVNDNEAPDVTCPADITVSTLPGSCNRVVNFGDPTTTDNCPGALPVVCTPPSGAAFPIGVNNVNCSATDTSGNIGTCSFHVVVEDTEPPVITCPADITVAAAQDQCSSNVVFNATATDNCPGVSVVCVPPSGAPFPSGVTTVDCTATDASGNTDLCSFNVTVTGGINDTQPPVITCPANITVPAATDLCESNVTFLATATDNCPGVAIECVPPSGFAFQVGTIPVICIATDVANNTDMCEFNVTVNDTEDPSIICPADVVATAPPGQDSAVVNFPAPVVSDNCPGVNAVCAPPSGSAFPVGVTPVTCTATDAAGNTAMCTFNVTVNPSTGEDVNCSLLPVSATNEVNTSHILTATVLSNNVPVAGAMLDFRVVSGPNQGKFGKGETDADGRIFMSYTGNRGVGVDQISATGTVSGVSISCTCLKEWVAQP